MNHTILIIANGPSALTNHLGKQIDSFPEIARINNYKISGYEKFIGSKTTIWFNGANRKLTKRYDSIPEQIIVSIPYQLLKEKEKEIIRRTPNRLGLKADQYTLINKDKMRYYESICKINRPTTGLNCILWAMDNYKNVIIHGFDFFMNSRHHYYDSYLLKKILDMGLTNRAKKHDNSAEKKYVETLVNNNKIHLLTEWI